MTDKINKDKFEEISVVPDRQIIYSRQLMYIPKYHFTTKEKNS